MSTWLGQCIYSTPPHELYMIYAAGGGHSDVIHDDDDTGRKSCAKNHTLKELYFTPSVSLIRSTFCDFAWHDLVVSSVRIYIYIYI